MQDSHNDNSNATARLAENLRHIADSLSDPKDAAVLRDYAAELKSADQARKPEANSH